MDWRSIAITALGTVTVISAASTSEECANLVPLEDRRRGKGAFFSGCESRSATGRGGCWDSLVEEHSGCQSCIVQGGAAAADDVWSSSVFSHFFEVELDPCPASVAELYGTPEGGIVSFEEVQSAGCGGDGWFSFESSCYSKSSYLGAAETWQDADARCGEIGARLVSMESEGENDFVMENLLWIGFLGEAYTGLRKTSGDGNWGWVDSLAGFPPGDFDPASSYQDWGAGLDASSSYASLGASCLEITPYLPKTWNPFSCEVNKQYVCEKPAATGIAADATSPPSAAASLLAGTPAPSDEVTTVAPSSQSPTPTATATTSSMMTTSSSPRSNPTTAPTAVPTTATQAASPAPSSLTPVSSVDAERGPPQSAGTTGAPTATSTGSSMPRSASTEFPAELRTTSSPTGSPTASPTGSLTGSPTLSIDSSGAGKLCAAVGLEVPLMSVLLFALGLCTA